MMRTTTARRLAPIVLGMLAVPVVVLGAGRSAGALTTITVTTNADAGAGSLRQAILDASTGGPAAGDDVEIVIPASVGTIALTTALTYDGGTGNAHNLTIVGNGTTVDQQGVGEYVLDATAAPSTGTLTVRSLVITISGSGSPGARGLLNGGPIVLDHVTISGSLQDAVNSTASITVTDSIVRGNGATGLRGESMTPVTVIRSTLTGNARFGILTSGDVLVVNSTITGNGTLDEGGNSDGIATDGSVTLVYSTVVENGTARADWVNIRAGGSLTSFASVVALKGATANCVIGGITTSNGYNFSDDSSCGFTGTGDRQGAGNNPVLGALAANGGPTPTRLPLSGSPLIDGVPNAACQAAPLATGIGIDQRSLVRPERAGGNCDIGAVEVQVPPVVLQPRFTG